MSTLQTIGIGANPDDGNGDDFRTGGQKINDNFAALNTDKAELSAMNTALGLKANVANPSFTGSATISRPDGGTVITGQASGSFGVATFISGGSFFLNVHKGASGSESVIAGLNNGLNRWQLVLGDASAESGSNTGSDAGLYRHADNGTRIAAVFTASRLSGNVFFGNGIWANNVTSATTIKHAAYTVATLPSAAAVGSGTRACVTNANSTTFNAIVAGGGSNFVPVISDGTNWRIG